MQKELWKIGAWLSLRGALLKMGIQNLDPRKKTKLAGERWQRQWRWRWWGKVQIRFFEASEREQYVGSNS